MTAHASRTVSDRINCWRPSTAGGLSMQFSVKIRFAAFPHIKPMRLADPHGCNDWHSEQSTTYKVSGQAGQECKRNGDDGMPADACNLVTDSHMLYVNTVSDHDIPARCYLLRDTGHASGRHGHSCWSICQESCTGT